MLLEKINNWASRVLGLTLGRNIALKGNRLVTGSVLDNTVYMLQD